MRILVRRRTTETVTVTREFVRIQNAESLGVFSCADCALDTRMRLPDEAAILSGVNTREIYRLVETGLIHFRETGSGNLVVCMKTLFQASEAKDK